MSMVQANQSYLNLFACFPNFVFVLKPLISYSRVSTCLQQCAHFSKLKPNLFKLVQADPNLFKLIQTYSNLFKLVQTCPNFSGIKLIIHIFFYFRRAYHIAISCLHYLCAKKLSTLCSSVHSGLEFRKGHGSPIGL